MWNEGQHYLNVNWANDAHKTLRLVHKYSFVLTYISAGNVIYLRLFSDIKCEVSDHHETMRQGSNLQCRVPQLASNWLQLASNKIGKQGVVIRRAGSKYYQKL